jgi:hypothetical protein
MIDVYDTPCKAGLGNKGIAFDSGDFNTDCTTNIADFAVVAEAWLNDYTLLAPEEKPAAE